MALLDKNKLKYLHFIFLDSGSDFRDAIFPHSQRRASVQRRPKKEFRLMFILLKISENSQMFKVYTFATVSILAQIFETRLNILFSSPFFQGYNKKIFQKYFQKI